MGMSFKRHFSFFLFPPSVLLMPLFSPRQPRVPVPRRASIWECVCQPSHPTSPDIRWIFCIQRRSRVIGHAQSVWEDIIQSMFVMKCTLWGQTPCVPCRMQRPGGRQVKCLAVPAHLQVFFKARIYSAVPPVHLCIERFGVKVSVQCAHVILNKIRMETNCLRETVPSLFLPRCQNCISK